MNKKIYNNVISGKADNSINFNDFRNLIIDLGFNFIRQSGSHVQYYNSTINERMTIQNDKGKAKGYQVRQLRNIIIKHGL
ncbi:MAG: type II toxin-antitoxin system HicA family toxin [Clostridium sp.]|nr:type II toxin-antitoxin system HicA family toxin [Clostridium sp.]